MPHVPRNRCCYPDTSEISFLPSEAVDWIGNPGTVQIALDELADRVHEIEINGGGPIGDVDASIVTYTPSVDVASCWQGSSDPGNVNDALDQIALRICDIEQCCNSTYFHTQSSPSTTWSVFHNLGRMPSVSIRDYFDVEIEGQVSHVSLDQLVIEFNKAITGTAYCV